ncbi:MAG: molybdopterin-dependent oxidoreductase, partial [Candidatus Poseidoniaceae archaeon]|nr:molybdopterin-dependent oxidoreductase [Candidatus Poseidoniaceae archaeon]
DLGSYSSRVTFMNANAAISAAMKIRSSLIEAAAEITSASSDSLVIGDRRIYARNDPAVGVSYLEALHKAQEDIGALVSSGAYRTPPMGNTHKGAAAGLAPAYSFSAYVAEVEVDVETGQTKVVEVWAAHDCGRALNPLAVEGQIIGSCHMGMGQVLSEEMVYGRSGNLRNANLLEYKIPTIHEMPKVTPIIVESNDPEGPFGAKEAGEGPLLPILPAVVNAIYDASGIRVDELPVTPDRLYKKIERKVKSEGLTGPLQLPNPSLQYSELQDKLVARANSHGQRDNKRKLNSERAPYHNGALFGLEPTEVPESQVDDWVISVTPSKDYLSSPRPAGSAWKHIERRHREE